MATRPLTPKQQRFVEEYLVDLNAAGAYRRAGYACKSDHQASANAARLMANDSIQAAIAAAQAQRSEQTQITAERVLAEYARLAFSDIGQILDFTQTDPRLRPASDIPEDARRAVSSIKVRRYFEGAGEDAREVEVTEFRLWSKVDALGKLAAHLGMLDAKKPLKVDVTSGGLSLDRNTLTAADLAAVAALVEEAGGLLRPDGGSQPVDPPDSSCAAAPLSPVI